MSGFINTFEDEQQFRDIAFRWTVAWDTKDLSKFLEIAAPTIVADYTEFLTAGFKVECPPEILWNRLFHKDHLGDPKVETQHFLGASTFTRVSESEAKGSWQAHAYHARKLEDEKLAVWDSRAYVEQTYVKADEGWKLRGWRPHTVLSTVGHPGDVMVGLSKKPAEGPKM